MGWNRFTASFRPTNNYKIRLYLSGFDAHQIAHLTTKQKTTESNLKSADHFFKGKSFKYTYQLIFVFFLQKHRPRDSVDHAPDYGFPGLSLTSIVVCWEKTTIDLAFHCNYLNRKPDEEQAIDKLKYTL